MSGPILPRQFRFNAAEWGLQPMPGCDAAAVWLNEMLNSALPLVSRSHNPELFVHILHELMGHLDPQFCAMAEAPRDLALAMGSQITGAPLDRLLACWKRCDTLVGMQRMKQGLEAMNQAEVAIEKAKKGPTG